MGKLGTGAQSEWKMVKLTKIDQLFCHSPKNFLGNKHDKGKRTLVILAKDIFCQSIDMCINLGENFTLN